MLKIKQAYNRFKSNSTVHGFQADITFRIHHNAHSKDDFIRQIEDDEIVELVKQTFERNGYAVADRDGYEPRIEVK